MAPEMDPLDHTQRLVTHIISTIEGLPTILTTSYTYHWRLYNDITCITDHPLHELYSLL